MLDFFKSKAQKKTNLIYEMMSIWHAGCIASVENKESLKEPRAMVGAILFFIGSMDNLCKMADFDDDKFIINTSNILEALDYPKEFFIPVFMNFYDTKKEQSPFALNANIKGGEGVERFFNGKDLTAGSIFSELIKEWIENPEIAKEDLYLFDKEMRDVDSDIEDDLGNEIELEDMIGDKNISESKNAFDENEEIEFLEDEKEKELIQKYDAVDLESYDSGYTAGIQKIAKERKTVLFRGSVDDIFSLKNVKYVKISTFFYDNEYSGNIEIGDAWEDFFMENGDGNDDDDLFFDPFYFIIKLTKADLIASEKESIGKNIFLEGNLIHAEKVTV